MKFFATSDGTLLFTWSVIDRAVRKAVESGTLKYVVSPHRKITAWQPTDFTEARGTVWDFPSRGSWAVHDGEYRGNWPPRLVRNLIQRYTNIGDLIVDPFCGGGTTLIESYLLARRSVGLDISRLAYQISSGQLRRLHAAANTDGRNLVTAARPKVLLASAIDLDKHLIRTGIRHGEIKLLCIHPPYLDTIRYTLDIKEDLSAIADPTEYISKLTDILCLGRSFLADDGYCAVLIGDVRRSGTLIPLGFLVFDSIRRAGMTVTDIIIKTQHNDRSTAFYANKPADSYLLSHEYLLIAKPGK